MFTQTFAVKILALLLFAVFIPAGSPAVGQRQEVQSDGTTDTKLIPRTAIAAIIVHPKKTLFHPQLSWIPREILAAQTEMATGIDLREVVSGTVVIEAPNSETPEPTFAIVLRCAEEQQLSGTQIESLKRGTLAGREAYLSDGRPYEPIVVKYDSKTFINGMSGVVENMLQQPEGDLSKLIQRGEVKGLVRAYWNIKASRDFVNEAIGNLPLQGPLERLKKLPQLLEDLSAGIQYSERLQTDIVMTAVNESAAEEVKSIIENNLTYLHAVLLDEMSNNFDTDDPVQAATVQYINRVWDKYEHKLVPKVQGRTLTIQLHEEIVALPMLAGFLGTTREALLDVERVRMQPENRLKMAALAMHNYESTHRHLPPAVIRDETGKPLFSGMVELLPYLEQQALYQQLDLTQAWNSPANRELTAAPFRLFSDIDGEGAFRLPIYPGSVWDTDEPLRFQDIRDGTSNTIMAIQAPPEVNTSWADPTPWQISETDPKRSIFGDRDSVWVAWMDGSVTQLNKSEVTTEQLKAMLTIAGGEVVNR